jgi:ABC-type transporter Mla MlaB component
MTAKNSLTLKLEGKLGGPWVDELQNCWKDIAAGADGKAIKIELRGVSYVDYRGRNLLLRMVREGAALVECSDFIRQILDAKDGHQKTARKITKKTKKENEHASTVRA